MSKYKIYKPFSMKRRIKSYLNPCNILFTLFMWILMASISLLKAIIKVIVYDIKYIYNLIHFRKINYSHRQIERMIREMSPREFEVFISELYKNMGYVVELTPETCDGGKDIILYDKNESMIYVECKHFAENNYVGREICQKLIGSITIDGADSGVIVCTGKFHKNAWEVYSKIDNLELIDMRGIMKLVREVDVHNLPRIFMKTLDLRI
ncbi:restriction endonuclease [Clostridium sp. UBA1056]|uniref:restriction endonuclease n=1 Tax=unclassified Clostridium TaxID=2614128 RepID=UPI003217F9DA